MLDRGGGGRAYQREGGYLTGGFNIGFKAYFTIIEVKKIIRRFFISRFSVTSLWQISQRN